MKAFVFAAILVGSVLISNKATAAVFDTMCYWNINGDSGHSHEQSVYEIGCRCRDMDCHNTAILASCSGTYETEVGTTVSGNKCCADYDSPGSCLLNGQQAPAEEIVGPESSLTDVYSITAESMLTEYFYGIVDNVNRSPSGGRGNSVQAKLDACLFYSDVNNLGTGLTGYNNCIGTSIGCGATNKNEYCQANSAAVCKDRCECYYGYGTCNNL